MERVPVVPTMFDRPQALLLPDPAGVRPYGNVSNRMEVVHHGRPFWVAVEVPSMLFTLMRDVLAVERTAVCTLALDIEPAFAMFSLMVNEGSLHDLWLYPRASYPDWVHNTLYRVR